MRSLNVVGFLNLPLAISITGVLYFVGNCLIIVTMLLMFMFCVIVCLFYSIYYITTYITSLSQSGSHGISALMVEPETDKLIAGGAFRSWNGTNVQGLTKLNSDGTLDLTFTPNTTPTGSFGLPSCAFTGKIRGAGGTGEMKISQALNKDYLIVGSDIQDSGASPSTGSQANIKNMTWNNVSASFGSTGYIPARIARITNSGSFPINGSYII